MRSRSSQHRRTKDRRKGLHAAFDLLDAATQIRLFGKLKLANAARPDLRAGLFIPANPTIHAAIESWPANGGEPKRALRCLHGSSALCHHRSLFPACIINEPTPWSHAFLPGHDPIDSVDAIASLLRPWEARPQSIPCSLNQPICRGHRKSSSPDGGRHGPPYSAWS